MEEDLGDVAVRSIWREVTDVSEASWFGDSNRCVNSFNGSARHLGECNRRAEVRRIRALESSSDHSGTPVGPWIVADGSNGLFIACSKVKPGPSSVRIGSVKVRIHVPVKNLVPGIRGTTKATDR